MQDTVCLFASLLLMNIEILPMLLISVTFCCAHLFVWMLSITGEFEVHGIFAEFCDFYE